MLHVCQIAHFSGQTQLIFIDIENNDKGSIVKDTNGIHPTAHLNISTALLILKQHYLRNFESLCAMNPLKYSLRGGTNGRSFPLL